MEAMKIRTGVALKDLDADKVAADNLEITTAKSGKEMVYFRNKVAHTVQLYTATEIADAVARKAANNAVILAGHTPHKKLILAAYGAVREDGTRASVSTKIDN